MMELKINYFTWIVLRWRGGKTEVEGFKVNELNIQEIFILIAIKGQWLVVREDKVGKCTKRQKPKKICKKLAKLSEDESTRNRFESQNNRDFHSIDKLKHS